MNQAPITADQLVLMTREQLIELLLMLLKIQETTTDNMQQLALSLDASTAAAKALTDKNQLLEAELLVLRSRPWGSHG